MAREIYPAHRVKELHLRQLLELRLPSSGHGLPQPGVHVGAQTRRAASLWAKRLDHTVAPGAACRISGRRASRDTRPLLLEVFMCSRMSE